MVVRGDDEDDGSSGQDEHHLHGLTKRRGSYAYKYRRNGNVSHTLHEEHRQKHHPRFEYNSTNFDVDLLMKDDEDARIMFESKIDTSGKDQSAVDKVTSYHSATILLKFIDSYRVLKDRFAWKSSVFVVRGVVWKVLVYVILSCVFFYFSMSVEPGSVVMADIRAIRNSLNTTVTFLLTAYITRCLTRWYSIVLVRNTPDLSTPCVSQVRPPSLAPANRHCIEPRQVIRERCTIICRTCAFTLTHSRPFSDSSSS